MLLLCADIIWRFWVWIGLPAAAIGSLSRIAGLTDIAWHWLWAPAWLPVLAFLVLMSLAITSRGSRRWLMLRMNALRARDGDKS